MVNTGHHDYAMIPPIYRYELTTPLGDQDWVPIPIYMRETRLDPPR